MNDLTKEILIKYGRSVKKVKVLNWVAGILAIVVLSSCGIMTDMSEEVTEVVTEEMSIKNEFEDITYTVELIQDTQVKNEEYGIVRAFLKGECIWTYTTETSPLAELDSVSEVFPNGDTAYIAAADSLIALNPADGTTKWSVVGVGGGNCCTFDTKGNIYISGGYGPNIMIISQTGDVLYEENDYEEYFWVYDLKIDGDTLYIYYGWEIPGVKALDISDLSNIKEAEDKILKGDFSSVAGKYEYPSGNAFELFPNGLSDNDVSDEVEFVSENIVKNADGSYSWDVLCYYNGECVDGVACILYPAGVEVYAYDGMLLETDISKVRFWSGQDSVCDVEYIAYKVDEN